VRPEELDIVKFISEYLSETTPLTEEKRQTLHFREHPKSLMVQSDPIILRNVIQSLVSNAIEYTHDEGTVTLGLKELNDSEFELTVADTGIGIPKEEQENIFQKFHRAENARLHKPDGSGLGLHITKEAIKLLGGRISFVSKEGEGTTFTVVLPVKVKAKEGEKTLLPA